MGAGEVAQRTIGRRILADISVPIDTRVISGWRGLGAIGGTGARLGTESVAATETTQAAIVSLAGAGSAPRGAGFGAGAGVGAARIRALAATARPSTQIVICHGRIAGVGELDIGSHRRRVEERAFTSTPASCDGTISIDTGIGAQVCQIAVALASRAGIGIEGRHGWCVELAGLGRAHCIVVRGAEAICTGEPAKPFQLNPAILGIAFGCKSHRECRLLPKS